MDAGVRALLEEHVVASVLKQMRLEAVVGEGFPWEVEAGTLRLAHLRCPEDVICTEWADTETLLWGWVEPGAPAARSAERMRRLGEERGLGSLTTDGELSLDEMDAGMASLIALGVADADGYFIAESAEGTVSLALRSDELRGRPVPLIPLARSFLEVASMLAFGHRRAFAHYLARPLPEVPAAVENGRAVLRGADGRAVVSFDREGRVDVIRVEVPPGPGPTTQRT